MTAPTATSRNAQSSNLIHLHDEALSELSGIMIGIEKEGLRVTAEANIAQTPHPAGMGSTLTHDFITTDYSEALLEFITPKQASIEQSLEFLSQLHTFALLNMPGERVWPASMPCRLQGDNSIPIAEYGTSNSGKMKHVYRRGLDVRYGRIMQSIAGIHYNFSLSDEFWSAYQKQLGVPGSMELFRSDQYFHLVRNFHRHSWILYYLFGASPVLDKSFFDGRAPSLEQFQENTFGGRFATSLRMSDLGYKNSAQQGLNINYDSLEEYIRTLSHAVNQPYAAYEKLGIKDAHGEYQQLNANILQIENEYYSEIRPKRVARSGERPVLALRRRGVEYVEVRSLDINPYLPVGMEPSQCRFIDAFLLYCLLSNSPEQCADEWADIEKNQRNIIDRGRDPDLELTHCGDPGTVQQHASQLLEDIKPCSQLLDRAYQVDLYGAALEVQHEKVLDSRKTPSGKMMEQVLEGAEFIDIIQEQARQHAVAALQTGLSDSLKETLKQQAALSLEQQREREATDDISFEEFLAAYNRMR